MSFKNIPGFENRYKINKFGVVKNNHDKIMSSFFSNDGYERVSLIKDGKKLNYYVHFLVGITYLKNPKRYLELDHNNHVRNDNRVENLRLCSRSFNNSHKKK